MNNFAIIQYIALHALQIQNVKRNVAKKINIEELNKDNESLLPVVVESREKNVPESKDNDVEAVSQVL